MCCRLQHQAQSTMPARLLCRTVLHQATGRSLLLIDELGRGTNARDATAFLAACAVQLAGRGARAILTTCALSPQPVHVPVSMSAGAGNMLLVVLTLWCCRHLPRVTCLDGVTDPPMQHLMMQADACQEGAHARTIMMMAAMHEHAYATLMPVVAQAHLCLHGGWSGASARAAMPSKLPVRPMCLLTSARLPSTTSG